MQYIKGHDGRRIPLSALVSRAVMDWVGEDSATSRNFAHELIQYEKKGYDMLTAGIFYPRMFNTKPITKGLDFVGWKQKLITGGAEFISRRQSNFPLSESSATLTYDGIAPIGQAYAVDYFQKATADLLGMNLDEDGIFDARQFIDFKIDEALHFGGRTPDGIGVRGILNYCNGGNPAYNSIPKFTLRTDGQGGSVKFEDKSGMQIFSEVKAFLNEGERNSHRQCRMTKLVIGEDTHEQFITKFVTGEGGDGTITVLAALKNARPDLDIIVNPYFDGVGGTTNLPLDGVAYNGSPQETWTPTSGDGVMLAYDDSDRTHQAPVNPFEVLRPYEHSGLITKVNCLGVMSSLQIKLFPAFIYAKGMT